MAVRRSVTVACIVAAVAAEDMKPYNDVRTTYAQRVFNWFRTATAKLPVTSPEKALRARYNLLRSVDVMSFTVSVQAAYEAAPPKALSYHADATEGARVWCGVANPDDEQAHELRILERLLKGLSRSESGLRGVDIGAGYGGWARLVATRSFGVAHINAAEYQDQISTLSQEFTSFAMEPASDALKQVITFSQGDVRKHFDSKPEPYDFMLAFLSLLHIGSSREEKGEFFRKIAAGLRTGGRVYFEDIVALPSASVASHQAKLKRVIWMNVLMKHTDYHELMSQAGFAPVESSKAIVYDVTNAWKRYVYGVAKSFQALRSDTQFCLQSDGSVQPSAMQGKQCATLQNIFASRQVAEEYVTSQTNFFCEQCELFNGKGAQAEADCGCPDVEGAEQEQGDDDSHPKDHPPLAGGAIIFAQRASEPRSDEM